MENGICHGSADLEHPYPERIQLAPKETQWGTCGASVQMQVGTSLGCLTKLMGNVPCRVSSNASPIPIPLQYKFTPGMIADVQHKKWPVFT